MYWQSHEVASRGFPWWIGNMEKYGKNILGVCKSIFTQQLKNGEGQQLRRNIKINRELIIINLNWLINSKKRLCRPISLNHGHYRTRTMWRHRTSRRRGHPFRHCHFPHLRETEKNYLHQAQHFGRSSLIGISCLILFATMVAHSGPLWGLFQESGLP